MPEESYIEISVIVHEQLRRLEPTERDALADGLLGSLVAKGRRIRVPGLTTAIYVYSLEGYAFFYRELTRKELAHAGKDFGYLVFDMRDLAQWIMGQLGG